MSDYTCEHGEYAMGRYCGRCIEKRERAKKEAAPALGGVADRAVIKRYTFSEPAENDYAATVSESPTGEWVRYEDIARQPVTTVADSAAGGRDVVEDIRASVDNITRFQARHIAAELHRLGHLRGGEVGWVSVDSAMPGRDVTVLVVHTDGWYNTLNWDAERTGWWDRHGNIYSDVTHWMPLPQPPKVSGGDGGGA